MNTKSLIAAITSAVIIGSAQAATVVVYEDTFDNDGLATNTGIGGGMVARNILDTAWGDNGNLVDTAGYNASSRGVVSTINAFDLSDGFTLEVQMTGGTTAILQSFALSTTQYTADTLNQDPFREAGWAGEGANGDVYAIGVETGSNANLRGLKFNNGNANASAITNLETTTDQLLPAGTNTFVLTVTPDNQYSYTYNGGTAATGSVAFDLSSPLYFNLYSQSDVEISYVKIEAVPEPGSLALLGLGGLCVMRRRRA